MTPRTDTPALGRRLLSLVYEILLLIAVLLLAGGAATALAQMTDPAGTTAITRIAAVAACAIYFCWQWQRSGQTLPMKTWRIRLETSDGKSITPSRALLRAILATAGYLLLGISILWVFIDRDRQFLHDRLAGTRLVRTS